MLAAQGQVDPAWVQQAFDKYRLDDVTAGHSGNAGGDA